MDIETANALDRTAFVRAFGGIFEHSPWVAERACRKRPFKSIGTLHEAMMATVWEAPAASQMALLRAHPELAGKAALRGELTADSTVEQSGAGLDQCSAEELVRLTTLNAEYSAKFGFPFILAVKGYGRAGILREFARRVELEPSVEFDEALKQVARITRARLDALLNE